MAPEKTFCIYCGAKLDDNGNHTDIVKTYWQVDGKVYRPRLQRVLSHMHYRCTNEGSENWKWYGGKGIRVCDEWRSYFPFREWALANGYRPGLVLDRIDSDKDYEPSNCRWVTSEQNQPRLKLTHDDVRAIRASTKTTTELGLLYDVHPSHILKIRNGTRWNGLGDR